MTTEKAPKNDPLRNLMNARRADAPTSGAGSALAEDDGSLLARFQRLQAMYDAQQQQLESLSSHASADVVTGLANSRTLKAELDRSLATARRYSRRHALMMIDIDGYAALENQLGEATGQQILRHVARLLRQNIRPTDIAARMQDGHFSLILNELRAIENAEMRAADLTAVIAATPCIEGGRSLHLSASVSFYVFGADDEAQDVLSRVGAGLAAVKPQQHT